VEVACGFVGVAVRRQPKTAVVANSASTEEMQAMTHAFARGRRVGRVRGAGFANPARLVCCIVWVMAVSSTSPRTCDTSFVMSRPLYS